MCRAHSVYRGVAGRDAIKIERRERRQRAEKLSKKQRKRERTRAARNGKGHDGYARLDARSRPPRDSSAAAAAGVAAPESSRRGPVEARRVEQDDAHGADAVQAQLYGSWV